MTRRLGPIRATGPLGAMVLGTFLFGLGSGPVRPCLSHPGHEDTGLGGTHSAPAHGAAHHASSSWSRSDSHPSGPKSDTAGCDCLGLCHGEQSPVLPGSAEGAALPEPAAFHVVSHAGDSCLLAGIDRRIPPARAPPIIA